MRGAGGHQRSTGRTDVWLTPPDLLEELGPFDLDPCAAPPPRPWATASTMYALPDDGLALPWFGRVFVNPPYGMPNIITPWVSKLAGHGRGLALIFARTETKLFFNQVWRQASAVFFLEGRLRFHRRDGTRARDGAAPSVLIGYGDEEADVLAALRRGGQFVALRLSKRYFFADSPQTWREAVMRAVQDEGGKVELADLYRALMNHPKARGRKHWREKVRQTLQLGPFESSAPGTWSLVP